MADTSSTDISSTDISSRTFRRRTFRRRTFRRTDISSNGHFVKRTLGLKDIFCLLYISTFNCFGYSIGVIFSQVIGHFIDGLHSLIHNDTLNWYGLCYQLRVIFLWLHKTKICINVHLLMNMKIYEWPNHLA